MTRVSEGAETPLFKENFEGWIEEEAAKGLMVRPEPGKKVEKKAFDAKAVLVQNSQNLPDAYVFRRDNSVV